MLALLGSGDVKVAIGLGIGVWSHALAEFPSYRKLTFFNALELYEPFLFVLVEFRHSIDEVKGYSSI
jgi:hypothetical protein